MWWILAVILIGISLYTVRSRESTNRRRITLAAFCAAAAFAVFQVGIPVFGGVHLTLTPLIGILVGPFLGSLVVLIVNILSAGIGHGGWGLVGANTVVSISEVAVGFLVFRLLRGVLPGYFPRAAAATFIGLICGSIAMVFIILLSGIQGVTQGTGQVLAGLSFLLAVNTGMAVAEACITGLMVAYIGKVRPDILGEGAE